MEFNFSDMLFAAINFFVMAIILTKLLYKPVLKIIDERQDQLQNMQTQTREALECAQEQLKSAQEHIQSARKEANNIFEQANKRGEDHKQKLLEVAKENSNELITQAKLDISHEKEKVRQELQGEVVFLSMEVARHLMEKTIDAQDNIRLIDSFIEEFDNDEAREMLCSVAANQSKTVLEALVFYSTEPTKDQQSALEEKLSQITGKSIILNLVCEPSILGGLSVQVEDCVLDGSLSNKIAKLQKGILQS